MKERPKHRAKRDGHAQLARASDELPSVKTTAAVKNLLKPGVGGNPTWTTVEAGVTRGLSFTATTTKAMVRIPGNADHAITCRTDSPPVEQEVPDALSVSNELHLTGRTGADASPSVRESRRTFSSGHRNSLGPLAVSATAPRRGASHFDEEVSMTFRSSLVCVSILGSLAACSSSNSNSKSPDAAGTAAAQTPPMGAAAVEAWLALGDYKQWHCETTSHAARSPSPHGFNRICSNDAVSTNATGTGVWPEGAAAVKELLADATSTTPVGYAVYLKTAADSAAGANWYWYERVPLDSTAAPHDATTGVVADGMGSSGTAMSICVSCHNAAGSDAAHTPSPGGRDEVYTAVH